MALSARIGVFEFSGDEVRLAIVKTGGRAPRVLELHSVRAEYAAPEERPDALVRAVEAVVSEVKRAPVVYTLCVSSVHAVVRALTIPFRGARRVAAAVRFELERFLAIPIEELVVDFFTVSEGNGATEVLAVGVKRNLLKEQISILNAAGIEPDGVDIDAIGLTALLRACKPWGKELRAALHVREAGSTLVVASPKTVAYLRHLPFSAQDVATDPESVSQEVGNSLRAFDAGWKGAGEVASLTVTGVALPEQTRDLLAQGLEMPIDCVDLTAGMRGCSEVVSQAGAGLGTSEPWWEALAGTAVSGATSGTSSGRGYGVNLRKDDLAPKEPFLRAVPYLMTTSCLVLVMMLGVAWYFHFARSRNMAEAGRIKEEIASLEQDILALQNQGLDISDEILSMPSLLDILAEIGARMPGNKVKITELTVGHSTRPGPGGRVPPWITIEGEMKQSEGAEAFTAVLAELRQSKMFQVDEDPDLRSEGERSTFTIMIRRPGQK